MERRLAAILAADVAGYSRLMGNDEEGTLALLMTCRHALLDPAIERYRGRMVKTTGDGFLVVAGRYAEALTCAETAARSRPNYLFAVLMAAPAAAFAGRMSDAQKAIANLRRIASQLRISNVAEMQTMRPADLARWIEGLQSAGLPE